MWKNRNHHHEALRNNSVGFMRIKPDPMYKTANGVLNRQKRDRIILDYIGALSEMLDPMRLMVTYPGDVEIFVTLRVPVEGKHLFDEGEEPRDLVDILDDLAHREHVFYPEGEEGEAVQGMRMPFSFFLVKWQQRDTETLSLGRVPASFDGGVR